MTSLPPCPKCGDNRQVWANQITGRLTCHRAYCHTEIQTPPLENHMKLRIQKLHPNARVPEYASEVRILLTCHWLDDEAAPAKINPGDRVAQAVLVPVPHCVFEVCEQLTLTERGAGGFGSTGA